MRDQNKIWYVLGMLLLIMTKALPTTAQRPNIIFLLTDDHRADALGVAGNPFIQTPHLDRMAQEGIRFSNAYVTTSICSVSRASILSGQYMSRHRIEDFSSNFSGEAMSQTYPLLLKAAGYKIGFIGKYGVGNNPPADQFDYWACNREGQPPYEYIRKDGSKVHHTDSLANGVDQFLQKFGSQSPFCLSVSFKAPHELDGSPPTYPVQERYQSLYQNITIPRPETADPAYWNAFPDFFRTDQNIGRERWKPLFSTPELHQKTVKDYYRLISGVDEVVGKLRKQLESLGVADNTVIIFMGDNGFALGEHGLEGKWFGFEESIRVPLLIYDPRKGSKRGITEQRIALNIDIAPTILNVAGLKVPDQMQGTNLLAKKPLNRKEFFYEHTFLGSPRLPKIEGVVRKDIKYMKFIEHDYEQLYLLKEDPLEKENQAHNTQYAKKLKVLRERYKDLKNMVK